MGTLTNLERLDINDTVMTDVGLVHLQTVVKLERLDIFGAAVSGDAVERLQRAVPGLKVFR